MEISLSKAPDILFDQQMWEIFQSYFDTSEIAFERISEPQVIPGFLYHRPADLARTSGCVPFEKERMSLSNNSPKLTAFIPRSFAWPSGSRFFRRRSHRPYWKAGSRRGFRWHEFRSCCPCLGRSIGACSVDFRKSNVMEF
jgi:hypothetical protein